MLDAAAIAVITGAASNIIAYMAQGRIDALRTRLSAIFQRGTVQQQDDALRALHEDADALAQGRISEAEVTARWTAFLTAAYPDAEADIEALASAMPPGTNTVNIGSQNNYGSGTFIGRDNHGDINPTRQES
ncbi:hypothetical protein [Streptomyces caeruleatus]|uniref:Uncharacterized protein n=1 Tax=Streptomyces caeruleatus TaxID=661399 RepID=A0A117RJD9_9ACTN|nr:hypothetical protein [Streptomyces caeruleatus]KUN94080.1 hypothetical protein AQJ67_37635 [Streptomyces caeruleatus]